MDNRKLHISLVELLLYMLALLLVLYTDLILGELTVKPKDMVVTEGHEVTLVCSTDLINQNVFCDWRRRKELLERSEEAIFEDNFIRVGYRDRFSVNLTVPGQYNLQIQDVRRGDAGIYRCYDESAFRAAIEEKRYADAHLIVTERKLNCTATDSSGNALNDDDEWRVKEEDIVNITCEIKYWRSATANITFMSHSTRQSFESTGSHLIELEGSSIPGVLLQSSFLLNVSTAAQLKGERIEATVLFQDLNIENSEILNWRSPVITVIDSSWAPYVIALVSVPCAVLIVGAMIFLIWFCMYKKRKQRRKENTNITDGYQVVNIEVDHIENKDETQNGESVKRSRMRSADFVTTKQSATSEDFTVESVPHINKALEHRVYGVTELRGLIYVVYCGYNYISVFETAAELSGQELYKIEVEGMTNPNDIQSCQTSLYLYVSCGPMEGQTDKSGSLWRIQALHISKPSHESRQIVVGGNVALKVQGAERYVKDRSRLYVTLNQEILLIDRENKSRINILTLTSEGNQLSNCREIDIKGKVRRSLSSAQRSLSSKRNMRQNDSSIPLNVSTPEHAVKLSKDRYVVSFSDSTSSNKDFIGVLDDKGYILRTTKFEELDGKHLTGPYYLAVDEKDNIYVTDYGNERILAFTKKLEFIKSITWDEELREQIQARGLGRLYYCKNLSWLLAGWGSGGDIKTEVGAITGYKINYQNK